MFHFTKKRAVVIAVIGSLALGAGAYAYFTSTGTGSGSATVGTSAAWEVVTQPTTGGPMTPGGTGSAIETINYTVKNNSSGYQNLADVAISVADTAVGGGATPWTRGTTPVCSKDDFSIGGLAGGATYHNAAVVNLAPGASVTRTATIQMVDNGLNQDSCKLEAPPLHLVAS